MCVSVNLAESVHGVDSYTLHPGQRRYIYKDSDVNFGDAFRSHVVAVYKWSPKHWFSRSFYQFTGTASFSPKRLR